MSSGGLCPRCGHDLARHNDAGSTVLPPVDMKGASAVPVGQMCCYAKPDEGKPGIMNWMNEVCGCSFSGQGTKRWY